MERRSDWNNVSVLIILPLWCRTYEQKNIGKLLKLLDDRKASIYVYCGPSDGDSLFKEFLPNAHLLNFRSAGSYLSCLLRFIKLITATKFDIVLWTYSGYKENLVLALYRLIGGIHYVIKSDSSMPPPPNTLRSKVSRALFFKFPARMSDLLIVESKEVEEYARKHYRTDNVYLFPNGVPVSKFKDLDKFFASQEPPVKHPYILYTGRICHEKGIDLLMESFALIADKVQGWTLEIVGMVWDEEYDKKIKSMIRDKQLEDRIIIHPPAFGRDLYRWYYFADFFVLPSRDEGLANRIPEAMFFRNPVVAFNVGQTRSMVNGDTGVLVPENNTGEFAKAMMRMVSEKGIREKMGEKAKAIIEDEYNDEVRIPQLVNRCRSFF